MYKLEENKDTQRQILLWGHGDRINLKDVKPDNIITVFYTDGTDRTYFILSEPSIDANGVVSVCTEIRPEENDKDFMSFIKMLMEGDINKNTFCDKCPIKNTFTGLKNPYGIDDSFPVCNSSDGICHYKSKECLDYIKNYIQELMETYY